MWKCPFFPPSFVGLFPWHSSIQCFVQSLFKDSQNWVLSVSHSKPTRLFKWRSPPPLSPGHPGLWRDSVAISWVLSCLQGRGKKTVNTKHFMAKTVENVPDRVQCLRVNSIFPQANRTLSKGSTELHFFPQPCTFQHNVNHDLHRCYLIGQLRSGVVNQ